MNAAKVIYMHRHTNETFEDELPDMPWYQTAFYFKYVQLDLEVAEHSFDSSEWILDQFIPPNILVFSFNDEPFTNEGY